MRRTSSVDEPHLPRGHPQLITRGWNTIIGSVGDHCMTALAIVVCSVCTWFVGGIEEGEETGEYPIRGVWA